MKSYGSSEELCLRRNLYFGSEMEIYGGKVGEINEELLELRKVMGKKRQNYLRNVNYKMLKAESCQIGK